MLTAVGAHPVTECAFVDTKLLRHSGDRARRLDHRLHSFIFEFRREALLRSRQLLHLSRHPSYWTDCPEDSGHPIHGSYGHSDSLTGVVGRPGFRVFLTMRLPFSGEEWPRGSSP